MTLDSAAGRLERLDDIDAIWHGTRAALADAGLPHVIYLTAGPGNSAPFLLTTLPELHAGRDLRSEPFLAYCCESYAVTGTGPEYLPDHAYLDDAARALVARAGKMGFRSGLAVPMRLSGSDRYGGFNLGCGLDRARFEAEFLPRVEELRFFCLVVHRRIEELAQRGAMAANFRRQPFPSDAPVLAALTPREKEVIHLIAQGRSRKECARICHISPHTVAEYTKSAYRKLGVHNRVEAARLIGDPANRHD